MKKKILAAILATSMVLSMSACGGNKESKPETKKDNQTMSADKNLLSVEITLPASLVGEEEEGATLDAEAKKAGVKEITKNDDGSVTMKMTKSAHKKLLNEIKASVDESIAEILEDKENCPSFDSITYNDDLTVFDINVDKELYGSFESLYALTFYFGGNIYQALNAVPEDQIKTIVHFKDKDTGEIIETADSSALEDLESSEE